MPRLQGSPDPSSGSPHPHPRAGPAAPRAPSDPRMDLWTLGWVMSANAAHQSPMGRCPSLLPLHQDGRARAHPPSLSPRHLPGCRPADGAAPAKPSASPARAPSLVSLCVSPGGSPPTPSWPHQRPRTPSFRPQTPALLAHKPHQHFASFKQHTTQT